MVPDNYSNQDLEQSKGNSRKKILSETLTVMFIDIVGYTKKTNKLSREEFDSLHNVFDNLSIPIFEAFNGNVIKKIGDAFLVTFKLPTDALLCGVELQKSFQEYSKNKDPREKISIRAALDLGEVMFRGYDVYGDTVNTAARIEGVAGAGQVVFSGAVFSAMNKNEVRAVSLGLRKFKGLKYPIRVFRVRSKRDERVIRKKRMKRAFNNFTSLLIGMAFLVFIVLLMYFVIRFVLTLA
ncbi:MAG: adenylate/guanylate cyclase domain-containing protein [Nanoarchaeota archaeon]